MKKKDSPIADALRSLRRGKLDCNQQQLADLLGVSLSTVAKWETGQVVPSQMALLAISKLDKQNRDFWISQAGETTEMVERSVDLYKRRHSYVFEDMLIVPIITTLVEAGTSTATSGSEYEGSVAIPIPAGGETSQMVAARITEVSVSPSIPAGSIVVIDTRKRLPKENVGYVVAARDPAGITIKAVRENLGGYFLLAWDHDFEPELQRVDAESKSAIAGRVVKWIAEPPGRRDTKYAQH